MQCFLPNPNFLNTRENILNEDANLQCSAYQSIGLLLQGKYTQLPLALKSLTSVFGMGTGVTSSLKTLGNVYLKCAGQGMCSPVRLWRDRRNRCDLFAQDTEKFLRTHKKHHNQ